MGAWAFQIDGEYTSKSRFLASPYQLYHASALHLHGISNLPLCLTFSATFRIQYLISEPISYIYLPNWCLLHNMLWLFLKSADWNLKVQQWLGKIFRLKNPGNPWAWKLTHACAAYPDKLTHVIVIQVFKFCYVPTIIIFSNFKREERKKKTSC